MRKLIVVTIALALFVSVTSANATVCYWNCKPPVKPAGQTFTGHTPWWLWAIGGCASDILLASASKSAKGFGELTNAEADSCGLLYWYNTSTGNLIFVPHKPITTLPERTN